MAEEQQTIKKKISLTIKIKEKNLYSLRDPIGKKTDQETQLDKTHASTLQRLEIWILSSQVNG